MGRGGEKVTLRTISRDEVAKHKAEDDCWIILRGKVRQDCYSLRSIVNVVDLDDLCGFPCIARKLKRITPCFLTHVVGL